MVLHQLSAVMVKYLVAIVVFLKSAPAAKFAAEV